MLLLPTSDAIHCQQLSTTSKINLFVGQKCRGETGERNLPQTVPSIVLNIVIHLFDVFILLNSSYGCGRWKVRVAADLSM